ncbi:Cof-type HAD-IIB family hydrolase [Jeotgalibacillus soli]|uniref:Phosphoglycolate phosphatase n=1 Tax=Jeotgalibacillus soli TaxID=889306 RepID=A0A0C2RHC4_9BACL|nr:Cof-type HAD-IIB family hydrolase [Jeotgalibacillus soli]KIL49555.1 hypothetical protein KP78_10230 [Jeotgalibacillus soli]
MKTQTIKLIALDMDGTLLNDDHTISEQNRLAIKEAQDKGITVIISTGRPLAHCKDIADSLRLSTYLITVNGSEIWDDQLNIIDRTIVDTKHIELMWGLSQKHKTLFWASTVGAVWNSNTTFPDNINEHEWLKFGFDIEDDDVRGVILKELKENKVLEVTNSSPTNIEVNAAGINKAAAIQKVCKRLGLSMDQVMAVGDSLNDLAMIQLSGVGVAMGNAQPIVKESADWITDTNINDGVAKAIRYWT